VAKEFRKLGLAPGGGNGSYFQDVAFRRSVRNTRKVSLEVKTADGATMPLVEGVDYLVAGSLLNTQSDITSEAVFASFGIVAPELGRDDYEGLDVDGMLVAVLARTPDGIGISTTNDEDVSNNGALDNAAGIATLLETARMLMAMKSSKRTVLFLANTAEQKGLLGSQCFAKNTTLAEHKIVGNINLDMPVLTYDFEDVIVFGGDRSSLRGATLTAAQQIGIAIGEDPFLEQGIFTHSDHFRFIESGVPSVMLATSMANDEEEAWAEHFAKNYNGPSDDMNNNIDFKAAAKFAKLKTRITLQVASADEKLWNKGDFFGRQFNGSMATD